MKLKSQNNNKIVDFISSELSENKLNKLTFLLIAILVCSVFVYILFNLFSLQIINGKNYLLAANQNYKDEDILRAPRGIILDINNRKLVYNTLRYNLFIDTNEYSQGENFLLAQILNLDENYLDELIVQGKDSSRITILQDLNHNDYLSLLDELVDIDGIYLVPENNRAYRNSHIYTNIVGYIGDASSEDLNEIIDEHSRVGKTGVEKIFDNYLRGKDGVEVIERSIGSGEISKYIPHNAEPGYNITLNIDSSWQELGYELLSQKTDSVNGLGGAFVVMDTQTGEVRTLVSYPTVDLNIFSSRVTQEEYASILANPRTPLLDRSIGMALPTGSIFKVITAAAGLEEGVINDTSTYYSDACMDLPGGIEFCESLFRRLGEVDIYRALSLSSNIYFCNVGLELTRERDGIDTLKSYTDRFGIGRATGIDIPGESSGSMASPELKFKLYNEPWYLGDICNTVVGQGMVAATPLQMAVVMASIENGGKVLKPQIVHSINNQGGEVVKEYGVEVVDTVPISSQTINIIQTAMRRAVTDSDGTLRKLAGLKNYVTGKTGTATAPVQINGILYNEPHAWVMGIFEHDGRRYSYVVNIAHGGWGEGAVDVIKSFLESI